MDLLNVEGFESAKSTVAKPIAVEMTLPQQQAVKDKIRIEARGYSVNVNSNDINLPYRVSIRYGNEWDNYGSYSCIEVASAIASIVSRGYFGKLAKIGVFDREIVMASDVYAKFLADPRNAEIIARAKGELPCHHDENAAAKAA